MTVFVASAAHGAGLTAEISDGARRMVTVSLPHFTLAAGQSLHPAVGPAFTAVWTGRLHVVQGGRYTFGTGPARMSLAGAAVAGPVALAAGEHPLRIEYTRPPGPARLQITWSSEHFTEEPLPPSALRPDASSPQVTATALRDRGRLLTTALGCGGCHSSNAARRPLAPTLTGVGGRTSERWIYHWLADPGAFRADASMPTMLDEGERRDVAAYLAGLRPAQPLPAPAPPSAAEQGERLFGAIGCTACHGSGALAVEGMGSKATAEVLSAYLRDPLAVNPTGRMPAMGLNKEEADALAAHLVRSRRPAFEQPIPAGRAADPGRGRALVQERGCLGCHGLADPKPLASTLVAPLFAKLRPGRGCVAAAPGGRTPRYRLDQDQRRALDAYLAAPDITPAPAADFEDLVAQYRCRQCHELGGPAAVKFQDVPPALDDTGNKLRTGWIEQVLAHQRRVRPWMTLRMPHFGAANVGPMAALFATVAGAQPGNGLPSPEPDAVAVREGVRSLGRGEEGLACITCHDFGGVPSQAGIRAPDMKTMADRIRGDWFRRWMLAPARIQPGTQMPTFFAGVAPEIAERRIGHLWGALALGEGLPRPEGLTDGQPVTLKVEGRPIAFRTFLAKGSTMSIVFGFPGGRSFAFDADRCRLQMAWTGDFLDVTSVWVGRGGGEAKPLGRTYPLETREAGLRIGDPKRAPTVKFRGYGIEAGAALLRYEIDGQLVREQIAPSTDGAGWVRRISVAPGQGDVWLGPAPESVRYQASVGSEEAGSIRVPRTRQKPTQFQVTVTPREAK